MSTQTETPDLSSLSAQQLEHMLEKKRKQERKERQQRLKQYETDKSAFLTHTASKFQSIQNEMRELKQYTIAKANELWQELHDMNAKPLREDQKQFTLKNAEDTLKITVDMQEKLEFTEEAHIHINSIRERFKEKFASRNKGLYDILDGLLLKNSKKEYDPKLLAKARVQVRKLDDAELIGYFDKLDECQRVTGSSLYCRIYVRDGDNSSWKDVSLQFSSL